MNLEIFAKQANLTTIASIAVAIAIVGGMTSYKAFQSDRRKTDSKAVQTVPKAIKITALGRLEPEAQIVKLSAPLALDGDRRVGRFYYSEV